MSDEATVEFVVTPADEVALFRNQFAKLRVGRKLIENYLVLPTLAFLIVIAALSLVNGEPVWREQSAALGVIGILTAAYYCLVGLFAGRHLYFARRRFFRAVRVASTAGPWRLTVAPTGLHRSGPPAEVRAPWSAVKTIELTDQAIYLSDAEEYTVIIPRHAFADAENYRAFHDKLDELWRRSTPEEVPPASDASP